MAVKVTRDDTDPEQAGHAAIRRYLRREDDLGIGIGVASFGPLPQDGDPTTMWEAHDVAESHYVLSGHGAIREEDEEIELAPGDVVITPAGRRHVLWARGEQPLVTVYCAVSPR